MPKKTGTNEWSKTRVNFQMGCEHDCLYCYAREQAVRFKRCTPGNWSHPVIDQAKVDKGYGLRDGIVMFPSTHDITSFNIEQCLTVLEKLLASGNKVLIVSKPSLHPMLRLLGRFRPRKKQILLRFTIGSCRDDVLAFWEPGASKFSIRLHCLEEAFHMGYATSVSSEPYLDHEVERLYDYTKRYITESFWIGKLRHLNKRVDIMQLTAGQIVEYVEPLQAAQTNEAVLALYNKLNGKPHIKWKDSIRDVIARNDRGLT